MLFNLASLDAKHIFLDVSVILSFLYELLSFT